MKSFNLKILAGNRNFYDGECVSLTVPTFDGEMGILANHANMVFALVDGMMNFISPDGKRTEAFITCGFAEIINNKVIILVHTVERPEEIDMRRAAEAKERAEEELRQKQSKMQYYHSKASLARAMARMKAARRK